MYIHICRKIIVCYYILEKVIFSPLDLLVGTRRQCHIVFVCRVKNHILQQP